MLTVVGVLARDLDNTRMAGLLPQAIIDLPHLTKL